MPHLGSAGFPGSVSMQALHGLAMPLLVPDFKIEQLSYVVVGWSVVIAREHGSGRRTKTGNLNPPLKYRSLTLLFSYWIGY